MSDAPRPGPLEQVIARALGVKSADPKTAFRDLSLPDELRALLVEPMRRLGFELSSDRLENPYETTPVTVARGGGRTVYLLHLPGSILEQPTDEGKREFEALPYLLPKDATVRVIARQLEWVHPDYLAAARGFREDPRSGADVRVAPWAGIEMALLDPRPEALAGALGLAAQRAKAPAARDRVFISYSPADRKWRDRLVVHLKPLERAGLIRRWDQAELEPGDVSAQKVAVAVSLARVAVLLVSADFLESDAINDAQLPPLLDAAQSDQAELISVIVGDCLYSLVPSLSRFTPLNEDRPLNKLDKGDRETVLKRVAQAVMAAFTA